MERSIKVTTLSQTARQLNVSRTTVADIVRLHGLPTQPVSTNGKAVGLAPKEVRTIRRVLKIKTEAT